MDIFVGNLPADGTLIELQELIGEFDLNAEEKGYFLDLIASGIGEQQQIGMKMMSAANDEERKKLGDDVLFMGNLDTYTMTCDEKTTVDQTVAHIKEMIDNGVDAVMPGCDLRPPVIEANMKAAVDTTHEYGRKASPAVGRT